MKAPSCPPRERDARRHGVAAALDEQTGLDRLPDDPAQIDAGDRAARAGASLAVEGDGESRAAKFLLEPRRDKTDDAGVPAFAGNHDHRAFAGKLRRRQRFGRGDFERGRLDCLALAVEPVQILGDLARHHGIAAGEQFRAERRIADTAAGIDARPDQEAEMLRGWRPAGAGDIEERRKPWPTPRPHQGKALGHERAVQAGQRRDVGDRRQGDEIKTEEQRSGSGRAALQKFSARKTRFVAISARKTTPAAQSWPRPERSSLPIGIDDERWRQVLRRLMMVEHDHVEAEPPRLGERRMARRAAIDANKQLCSRLGQRTDGLHIRAVAFENAVRNMDQMRRAGRVEEIAQQRPPRPRHRHHNRRK